METDLLQNEDNLYESLCHPIALRAGFDDVKKNKGAPGIDGVTLKAFADKLDEELLQLSQELESWRYG